MKMKSFRGDALIAWGSRGVRQNSRKRKFGFRSNSLRSRPPDFFFDSWTRGFGNYAPELDLSLTCVRVQRYEVASPEYRFEVNCRIRHPTGRFEYFAKDLCIEPDGFARFAEELHSIQRGAADSAALKSVGEMLVFQLDRKGRKLSLRLSIREVLPPGKLASLITAIEADYDLLINKLGRKVEEFLNYSGSRIGQSL